MKYRVFFNYSVPYWGDIELDVDDEAMAEEEAYRHVEQMYPEAINIEIEEVELING